MPPLAGIPVDSPNTPPPTGELLPDVEMAEQSLPSVHTNGINGTNGDDVQMSEPEAHSPPVTPAVALTTPEASTSYLSPKAEADDEGPPAKRPRVHSDADRASLANVRAHPLATDMLLTLFTVCNTSTSLSRHPNDADAASNTIELITCPHEQPVSFYVQLHQEPQEAERCSTVLTTCRPCRSQRPSLPYYNHPSHGFGHYRQESCVIQPI